MKNNLPTIIVTGASGFVGSNFINYVKEEFFIFAIARRSSTEANIPVHRNILWIQWDISHTEQIDEIAEYLHGEGDADFMIHLAGYYDFDYYDKPEFKKTNVIGTKNVLELARKVEVKRFIFASSLAACEFPEKGIIINEKSSVDAQFAYAKSKKLGEEFTKEYSRFFNCSVVRFAAVYSDWCEYAPLYKFLETWLGKTINSKILGGKGESAITYIHIFDLTKLLCKIIRKNRFLPSFDTYIASPDGSCSHKNLFKTSTREFFGQEKKPLFVAKPIAILGINFLWILSCIRIIPKPFERPWMGQYIDKKLKVDSSYTQTVLGWKPTPRYHILRRLIHLLINIKSHSSEWKMKNEAALLTVTHRVNLIIYEQMLKAKDEILTKLFNYIISPENEDKFDKYRFLKSKDIQSHLNALYNLLLATIRSGDKSLIIKYIDEIAFERYSAGFKAKIICNKLKFLKTLILNEFLSKQEFKPIKQEIHDNIILTIQLAQDEVEDIFEEYEQKLFSVKAELKNTSAETESRHKLILKLSKPYQSYKESEEESDPLSEPMQDNYFDMM
jgi:nucleoside-diphosphate-sugar epimerase